jgi:exodeoxyribonuclease VII large subunit
VPDQRDLQLQVRRLAARMVQLQRHGLGQAMQRADRALLRLNAQGPQARLQLLQRRQQDLGRRLDAVWRQQQERRQAQLRHAAVVLRNGHPQRRLDALRERLQRLMPRADAAIGRQLQRDQLHLRGLARSMEAVSPLATVARGYSILTRDEDGSLVRSPLQVRPGDTLTARVQDGAIAVVVK